MSRHDKVVPPPTPDRATLDSYTSGPLAPFLAGRPAHEVDGNSLPEEQALVFSGHRLQEIGDYRQAIRSWFAAVTTGGHLVIVVPHAFLHERQNTLPSRWNPRAKRLYTPASLMEEVEEALPPNSYRVRWLSDRDEGYDYSLGRMAPPIGRHDVVVVLEKIAPPEWGLDDHWPADTPAPIDTFEPDRSRIEHVALVPSARLLVLKLDHLGDFLMGLPALRKLRGAFPDAEITLVVGSWNEGLARETGLADRVLVFDAYPRNSSEETVDVPGKKALFDALVTDEYDIAIDLRTESDTRFFLRDVRAPVKAALGSRANFPWLTIFLPIDITRHHHERAWEEIVPCNQFSAQPFIEQTPYQIACVGRRVKRHDGALVWGPYRRLQPGRYAFEPFLDIDGRTPGLLGWDVGLNIERSAQGVVAEPGPVKAIFTVDRPDTDFEFRLWMMDDEFVPDFRFHGGRLIKQGAESVLHHSEYLTLLVELIAMRVSSTGVFGEWGRP